MAKTIKRTASPSAQSTLTSRLLGQYVRAQRTQLGFRIEDAAAFCGVAKDTLMKLEHGHPKVQLGTALRICHGLGIKLKVMPAKEGDETNVWV